MNFRRLLNTALGKVFISILLGLGLATLFRKVCTDKNCITFNGPVISDVDGKIYQYGEKCYKYVAKAASCDSTKKIVDIASPLTTNGVGDLMPAIQPLQTTNGDVITPAPTKNFIGL
jgi:hypothetical protein